ncbi:uncharacterized protein LOC121055008 [Oryza brachyantha]|uniref:uncharacterized protein LOC121055008 n=1 Tax=Oryza brachyantha TaxID=4533 RepID=UPI001ADD3223|nr:uncharacterized protein LOC121055008 [Oryza brachyantha]
MDHGSCCVGGATATVSHLRCEINSVKVTGLSCPGDGVLFLRCHVPASGGRTIQIDSHGAEAEACVNGDGGSSVVAASWRDVASLKCDGSAASVRELVDRRSLVFEVRRRRRRPLRRIRAILGPAVGSSELLGRAEVAWRDIVAAAAAAADDDDNAAAAVVERRLSLPAAGFAVPAVMSVRMSVRFTESRETAAPVAGRSVHPASRRGSINAGCEWDAGGEDDVFAVAACVAGDALTE